MPAVIAIVGGGNSGKTTLIEKLIPVLNQRGITVGTVKHVAHQPSVDPEGKDSWRHSTAGADPVVVDANDRLVIFKKTDSRPYADRLLDTVDRYFDDVDLVLAEGYKSAQVRKIEVFRESVNQNPVCIDDPHLVAIVTDAEIDCRVPRLAVDDIEPIADLIEGYVK